MGLVAKSPVVSNLTKHKMKKILLLMGILSFLGFKNNSAPKKPFV